MRFVGDNYTMLPKTFNQPSQRFTFEHLTQSQTRHLINSIAGEQST